RELLLHSEECRRAGEDFPFSQFRWFDGGELHSCGLGFAEDALGFSPWTDHWHGHRVTENTENYVNLRGTALAVRRCRAQQIGVVFRSTSLQSSGWRMT